MNRKYGRVICQHCQKHLVSKPRGLCFVCYQTPSIRKLYPVTSKYARRDFVDGHELTAAEVDALVAEQSKPENLPAWFGRTVVRSADDQLVRLAKAIVAGKGVSRSKRR